MFISDVSSPIFSIKIGCVFISGNKYRFSVKNSANFCSKNCVYIPIIVSVCRKNYAEDNFLRISRQQFEISSFFRRWFNRFYHENWLMEPTAGKKFTKIAPNLVEKQAKKISSAEPKKKRTSLFLKKTLFNFPHFIVFSPHRNQNWISEMCSSIA